MVGVVFALALLAAPEAAPPADAPIPRVLVRVDTRAVNKHLRFDAVEHSVRTIWQPYAEIVFADAHDLTRGGYDDEIHLVVSDRAQYDATGAPALGWISFVKPGQPLNVVTVSTAAAEQLMAREKWMGQRFSELPPWARQQLVARAVSWSVAHEIGHYLLRTGAHSARGLMRPRLGAGEVMRTDRRWVRLEPHEIEALRNRASLSGLLADADAPAARSE